MKIKSRLLIVLALIIGITTCFSNSVSAKESKDYEIKVNLGTNCVTIYKKGKPIKAMICSPSKETPVGTFYTPVKYRWHEMIGNCYAQYCTRITTGILFHSVWYYKNGDKSTMSVSAYNVMGQKASHGCVRLLCEDAKWIYDNCALNTKVVTFWGTKKDDPIERPSFTPIKTGAFTSWDPTDPDPKNPYKEKDPTITTENAKIEYGSKLTAFTAATIRDCLGNDLTKENASIKIKGKINTKRLGTYKVKYTVKDSLGNKATKTLTYKVVDTKKPVIKGAKNVKSIAVGQTKDLLSKVRAKSATGKNLTSKIKVSVIKKSNKKVVKVTKGKVTFTAAGKYKVTYKVRGTNRQTVTKIVTYTVINKQVKVSVTSKASVQYGSKFNPLSYVKSVKTYDGKTLSVNSKNVKVSGTVNTTEPGTYTLVYTISDGGRAYTKVTRNVTVVVDKKPVEPTTEPATEPVTEPTEPTTNRVQEQPTELSADAGVHD